MNYFRNKIHGGIYLKKELIISFALTGAFFFGALFELSPFWSIVNLNERIKNYWEQKASIAPIPHAEDLTLQELAKLQGETVELLFERLKEHNIYIPDRNATLADIAEENKSKPYILYAYLKSRESKDSNESHNPPIQGLGYGRMTIEKICGIKEINIKESLYRLQKNNINADAKDNVRSVAIKHNLVPSELVILLEGK